MPNFDQPAESKPSRQLEFRVEGIVALKEAREILGEDVMGPEEIEKAFGFKPKEVPPLPYSREDLEKAKEIGEMLVLRTDKDGEGRPLTMQRISSIVVSKGPATFPRLSGTYRDQAYFNQSTPQSEWKLVSKDILPGSTNLNYLDQTRLLRDHLKDAGLLTPEDEAECSDAHLDEISRLFKNHETTGQAWRKLESLAVNYKHRRAPVEVLYDLQVRYGTGGERLLSNRYDWTNANEMVSIPGGMEKDGKVCVGLFTHDGASVAHQYPASKTMQVGVVSVR